MYEKTIFDDSQSKVIEASNAGRERPILALLEGEIFTNQYKIDEPECFMGRDLTCKVVLSDTKSSRRHARLTYRNFTDPASPPVIVLTDLGSTNGTFVNGARITEVELHDRDKILIGSTLFGYFIRDEKTLKADETLIRLASVDALTGLKNRGVFNVEIKREFDRARRYDRMVSLALFDIDHFKRFNDTYGHQAGDHVLRELGKLVMENIRSNDVAARYGGEEFAIILPETPAENAFIHAERLRKSIMNHSFSQEHTRPRVTVSIGLSGVEPTMESAADWIDGADRALYAAKSAGRNQVCWNRPPGDESARQTG